MDLALAETCLHPTRNAWLFLARRTLFQVPCSTREFTRQRPAFQIYRIKMDAAPVPVDDLDYAELGEDPLAKRLEALAAALEPGFEAFSPAATGRSTVAAVCARLAARRRSLPPAPR